MKYTQRLYLVLCFSFFSSCQKEDLPVSFLDTFSVQDKVGDEFSKIHFGNSIDLDKAIAASINSENRDKSVGVFGGSLSSCWESLYAKYFWCCYLNMRVFTYGLGGYGFSSLQGGIQDQVRNAKKHDIYILWASTNDYTNSREIGTHTDYTQTDGYDKSKLVTQCGGMNFCIKHLREINPKAQIFIFGSLPFFAYEGGYLRESSFKNELDYTFYEYIDAQNKVAEYQGVKFFNQFDIPVLTVEHSADYYKEDKYHMTQTGYANVGVYQLYFLSKEKELK